MGFFTSRERGELGKSAEPRMHEHEREEREVVRHDFAPRRRPAASEPDLTGHVGTLMRRVADTSLQDIDELIAKLQRRRQQLLSETERVQREIVEYAKLSQTTMQSTKIIAESLAHFNKLPAPVPSFKKVADAPRLSELHLANGDDGERRNGLAESLDEEAERLKGLAEALAQHDEDHGARPDEDRGTSESDPDGTETETP